MSVNSERMLPKRMLDMYQMKDLLQAEQVMLGIIEGIIYDMINEALLTTPATVTPEYLKKLVTEFFKLDCSIVEYQEEVIIKIRLHIKGLEPSDPFPIIEKTNGFIPAHLKVLYEYVSKQSLRGNIYVAHPRADYVRLSFPPIPTDSRIHKTIQVNVAIPLLEYIEIKYPAKATGG